MQYKRWDSIAPQLMFKRWKTFYLEKRGDDENRPVLVCPTLVGLWNGMTGPISLSIWHSSASALLILISLFPICDVRTRASPTDSDSLSSRAIIDWRILETTSEDF